MRVDWVSFEAVVVFHDLQIAEHGGAPGIRDEPALHSALARPKNLAAYGEPDLFGLAAAYACGVAKGHPFVDGNKRTAFVTALAFLDLNGQLLAADEAEATIVFLQLAAGEIGEAELASWFRQHCPPSKPMRSEIGAGA